MKQHMRHQPTNWDEVYSSRGHTGTVRRLRFNDWKILEGKKKSEQREASRILGVRRRSPISRVQSDVPR